MLGLGHPCLAAQLPAIDVRQCIAALPTAHIQEVHISGVQRWEHHWLRRASNASIDAATIRRFKGRLVEHLPMTKRDWALAAWAMERVQSGAWGQPWTVTFEYGAVGPLFSAVTEASILAAQIPRLCALVKRGTSDGGA